jgi:hypothetical protein
VELPDSLAPNVSEGPSVDRRITKRKNGGLVRSRISSNKFGVVSGEKREKRTKESENSCKLTNPTVCLRQRRDSLVWGEHTSLNGLGLFYGTDQLPRGTVQRSTWSVRSL